MIDVTDNVREVLRFVGRFSSQYPFAVASALTHAARVASMAMPSEVDRAFEGGAVAFTKRAFFVQRAEKHRLTAWLRIKDKQAEYLRYQIVGGSRKPKRRALRLPSNIELTAQGNIPSGTIARLVQRAKAGRRVTKVQAQRLGVSRQVDLMYGDPADGRPAGIYKRVPSSDGAGRLVPLVLFPQVEAKYRPTFEFHAIAARHARAAFTPALRQAWARAKATAR